MNLKGALKVPNKLKKISRILEQEEMEESALDPIHKDLNRKIFDANEKMLASVRKQIMDGFYDWFEQMGHDKSEVKTMIMIGSNTGYQYGLTSDVDINITTTISDEDYDKIWEMLPNGDLVKDSQYPINYYLADDDSGTKNADSSYDLLKNDWIKQPDIEKIEIPYSYALRIATFFINGFDLQIAQLDRDKFEIDMYEKELKEENLEVEREDIEKLIARKKEELIADYDAIEVGLQLARAFRKEAFEPDYEPKFLIDIKAKSPNFSINNVVYKLLDRFGYIDRLHEIHKERDKYKNLM